MFNPKLSLSKLPLVDILVTLALTTGQFQAPRLWAERIAKKSAKSCVCLHFTSSIIE